MPLVTLLPLAYFKMPESVAWLASRGRMEEARALSERTGVPLPEPARSSNAVESINGNKVPAHQDKVGFAGLFSSYYLFPTIILGMMSAIGLMLVYSLNTWLPEIMLRAGFDAKGSLSFLAVLNGGSLFGALLASRAADRFGPKPVVAACFAIGAVALVLLTLGFPLAALLLIVAIVGLGTSGTQTLIYGFVANYYRTNVRAAGVAWCAGFGRLGGIGGPVLGSFLIGANLPLDAIFYVLGGIGIVGVLLTLLVPMSRSSHEVHRTQVVQRPHSPAPAAVVGEAAPVLYKKILLAIDATRPEEVKQALERASQLGLMTRAKFHVLHIARSHTIPGLGGGLEASEVENMNRQAVQDFLDRLAEAGVDAQGEIICATEYEIPSIIMLRARVLGVDLLVLKDQVNRSGNSLLQTSVAEQIMQHRPPFSILLARPFAAA